MGTFDGPGTPVVVFLQGCHFRCLYCAIPTRSTPAAARPRPRRDTAHGRGPEAFLRTAGRRDLFGRRADVQARGAGAAGAQAPGRASTSASTRTAASGIRQSKSAGAGDLILLDVKQADPERHSALSNRTRQRPNPPHGGMARRNTANRSGCATMWCRATATPSRHPHAGRAARRLQAGRTGRAAALPHARVHKYEADGKGVQTLGTSGRITPEQLGPRRGAGCANISRMVVVN